MTKPMIRKAKSPARTNRGHDTTLEEARSELIALLPKARLVFNPLTSAPVLRISGAFGLYCGDEGYFIVQPNPGTGFVSIPVEPVDARHWALAHNGEHVFDEYHRSLQAILKAHGVSL